MQETKAGVAKGTMLFSILDPSNESRAAVEHLVEDVNSNSL